MDDHESKQHLFNAFNPIEPLPPEDSRYVDWNKARSSENLLIELSGTIGLTNGPTCQLLSGHRGCGKTTELFRLRRQLENESYFVVYCESDNFIDLNDKVEFSEVFLAIAEQIANTAREQKIDLDARRLRSFFEGLWDILSSTVVPKEVKLSEPFGVFEIGFELKNNRNNRQLVREYSRPQSASLLQAVNEALEETTEKFKKHFGGCAGLVVIVDNLDRMLPHILSGSSRNIHDQLFVDYSLQLSGLTCHVIYTIPPELLCSSEGPGLYNRYGTQPQMMPMVPVATRAGEPDVTGIAALIEAVERRVKFAGVPSGFETVAVIKRLCTASGGYVRSLMTMARQSIHYSPSLPVKENAVEVAIKRFRDSLIRGLREKEWQILRDISQNKKITEDEKCLTLLRNEVVLEYVDEDGPWYDVHPVVREAKDFAS
jgi:AAA ATPase domain